MWAAKRGAPKSGAERERGAQGDHAQEEAALQRAARALGVSEDGALRAALVRVAAEGVASDPAFAARVRAELGAGATDAEGAEQAAGAASHKAEPASATKRGARETPRLVPIARVEQAVLDPFGPPNPLYLYRLYGAAQLPIALAQYSYASLKEAAALLPPDPAGERLRGRRSKDELIASIVARVMALAGVD